MKKLFDKKLLHRKKADVMIDEDRSLEEQVEALKSNINLLKLEAESKDVQLANLAREKEKLSLSLCKLKRSNENFVQQLEDERNFYFKEKESYCQEINEYKQLKKALSGSNVSTSSEEAAKLRKTLEQTLHTNYNLSVKFLRMKETKNLLRKKLTKSKEEHQKVVDDLKNKIERLTEDFKEVFNQKFEAPLSPSNKKYLQLINENSLLLYENLSLRTRLNQFNLQQKHKVQRSQSETNSRINKKSEEKLVKVFERQEISDSTPRITILEEQGTKDKLKKISSIDETKLEVFQVSGLESRSSNEQIVQLENG